MKQTGLLPYKRTLNDSYNGDKWEIRARYHVETKMWAKIRRAHRKNQKTHRQKIGKKKNGTLPVELVKAACKYIS